MHKTKFVLRRGAAPATHRQYTLPSYVLSYIWLYFDQFLARQSNEFTDPTRRPSDPCCVPLHLQRFLDLNEVLDYACREIHIIEYEYTYHAREINSLDVLNPSIKQTRPDATEIFIIRGGGNIDVGGGRGCIIKLVIREDS